MCLCHVRTRASDRLSSVFFVLSMRPLFENPPVALRDIASFPRTVTVRLLPLSSVETEQVVLHRLNATWLHPDVGQLIMSKTQGHPLYAQELASHLRETGQLTIQVVTQDDRRCFLAGEVRPEAVTFPDNLKGLIAARIDRLDVATKLTVKLASCIGRVFEFRLLCHIHPVVTSKDQLRQYMDALVHKSVLLNVEQGRELSYAFHHAIIQETVYDMLLFDQRKQMHQAIAEWYEGTYFEQLSPYYPLLAAHFEKAERHEKALEYAAKAGLQCVAAFNYAGTCI